MKIIATIEVVNSTHGSSIEKWTAIRAVEDALMKAGKQVYFGDHNEKITVEFNNFLVNVATESNE